MRNRSTGYRDAETRASGLAVSRPDLEPGGNSNTNSPGEVIGEIGLVLIVVLGFVVALNMLLGGLHVS